MDTKMKLYGDVGSQGTRTVLSLLNIAKIPYDFVKVSIDNFETRTKAFTELNPFSHIPFLIDGDFKLGESSAILQYICQKYPSQTQGMGGSDLKQRAIVNKYLSWYQNEFRPIFFQPIIMRLRYLLTGQVGLFTKSNEQFAFKRIKQTAILLNRLLKMGNKQFLCGDRITVADLLIYFQYTNLLFFGIQYKDLSQISAWCDRLQKIPQVNQIMIEFSKTLEEKRLFFRQTKPQPNPSL